MESNQGEIARAKSWPQIARITRSAWVGLWPVEMGEAGGEPCSPPASPISTGGAKRRDPCANRIFFSELSEICG